VHERSIGKVGEVKQLVLLLVSSMCEAYLVVCAKYVIPAIRPRRIFRQLLTVVVSAAKDHLRAYHPNHLRLQTLARITGSRNISFAA
jgi:hypothetical protein